MRTTTKFKNDCTTLGIALVVGLALLSCSAFGKLVPPGTSVAPAECFAVPPAEHLVDTQIPVKNPDGSKTDETYQIGKTEWVKPECKATAINGDEINSQLPGAPPPTGIVNAIKGLIPAPFSGFVDLALYIVGALGIGGSVASQRGRDNLAGAIAALKQKKPAQAVQGLVAAVTPIAQSIPQARVRAAVRATKNIV